jgi:hypothetical protein
MGARAMLLAATLCIAGAAEAQERVQFDLMVAQALEQEGPVDPACRQLSQRLPMRYGTLRMVQHKVVDLDLGKHAAVQLPSGRVLSFLPIQIVDRRLHVHYRMGDLVSTRLQLVSGKPVILGGEPFEGGTLIVQLTPSFAPPEGTAAQGEPAPGSSPRVRRVNAR